MKKQFLLFVALVFSIATLSFAQWVSLDKNSLPDSKPIVQIISDDFTSTVIKVEVPGFRIKEFNSEGKTYHSIDMGSLGITNEAGSPEIPHIAKILAIPDQGSVSVEVLETEGYHVFKEINIPPVRVSWMEGGTETTYCENAMTYNSENVYPAQLASVEDPVVFRDFRITRVSIFPLRYSPSKHEVVAIKSITLKVNYGNGVGVNPKLTLKKPIAPSFARMYKSLIFNYEQVLQREYDNRVTGYDYMLCFMPDSFVTSFQPYADWNHKTGTFIKVVKFSEIGATGTNPAPIKNYITTAYTTWPVPPSHILIIGDANVAPHQNITLDGWTFPYDDYFVEITGNDYFPEMFIGRFTNQANAKLRGIRNKLMNYEKAPYMTDPNWFRRALVCSNNEFVSQIETKQFAKQKLLTSGNFISVDTLFNGTPCPGNNTTISNMINAGRGWLNYRGEGWYTYWWADCFPYSTTEINALNNGAKNTFVTSIGCGVANWTNGSTNNFGEAWMEIGDENNPKGACGFVGPTSNTHTAYNNNIDKGIYVGMFDEGLESPGEALLRGKFYMYEVFGGADFYVGYHYRIYHVLGDPSLHIWKDTPRNIVVNYTDTIGVGPTQVMVTVIDAVTSQPIANELVCISGNNVYVVGTTLSNGTAILDVNALVTGQLNFTVSGGNTLPFEGTIQVVDAVTTFQLAVSVSTGWNMVSIPGLHPVNQNVDTWWQYRDQSASVFKFGGTGYNQITTTIPGEGYWMKHSTVRTYNTGDEWPAGGIQSVPNSSIQGYLGWNLIGGYENIVATSGITTTPPGLISGPLYEYSGGYQVANNLLPGYGYWIKLTGNGLINIPGSLTKATKIYNHFNDNWGRIILTDAEGNRITLYSVKGEVDLNNYELPPLPPAGMFDVRFSSGRIAENLNSEMKEIELNGITFPLTLRVENINIRLMDVTEKRINANVKAGEEIIINELGITKLLISGETLPTEYSLEQNYPNPFNPNTVIEFSLPEDVSNAKLSIYNALGEKVAELVNSSLPAGNYQYDWNAQNLATGIYIYELRTEKCVSMKKMILMK